MLLAQPVSTDLLDAAARLARAAHAPTPDLQKRLILDALNRLQRAMAEGCGISAEAAWEDPAFRSFHARAEQYIDCMVA